MKIKTRTKQVLKVYYDNDENLQYSFNDEQESYLAEEVHVRLWRVFKKSWIIIFTMFFNIAVAFHYVNRLSIVNGFLSGVLFCIIVFNLIEEFND